MTARHVAAALLALCAASASANTTGSTCHGTVNRGSIEHSVQLPAEGANYAAYSTLAISMGRNHVHSEVSAIILDAYAKLERAAPGAQYVYGESGNEYGGRFRP